MSESQDGPSPAARPKLIGNIPAAKLIANAGG